MHLRITATHRLDPAPQRMNEGHVYVAKSWNAMVRKINHTMACDFGGGHHGPYRLPHPCA